MEVDREPTFTLDKKALSFRERSYYVYYIFSNILKMCLSSSFIMSSSSAQLSPVLSVLLAAITHFSQTFFNITNSNHELLSPDSSGFGWKNILLAQN